MLSNKHQALLKALLNSSELAEAKIGPWKLLLVAENAKEDNVLVNLPEKVDFIILLESNELSQGDIFDLKRDITINLLRPLKSENKESYNFAIHTPTSFQEHFSKDYSLSEQEINQRLEKAYQSTQLSQLLSTNDVNKKRALLQKYIF